MGPSRARASEIHRRPTPHPGFDVAKFARDSERRMHAAEAHEKVSTAPPPPYHPASMVPGPDSPKAPPSALPAALDGHLLEATRRLGIVGAELAVGSLSREEASSVLRAELRALAASARRADAESLGALLGEIGGAVEELGGTAAVGAGEGVRVFVVDEDVGLRDRIALALESLGNTARTGASLRELAVSAHLDEPPDVVVVAEAQAGDRPDAGFANVVRELARAEDAQVIVYTKTLQEDMAAVARERGARCCFCPASGALDALAAQLAPILEEIGW